MSFRSKKKKILKNDEILQLLLDKARGIEQVDSFGSGSEANSDVESLADAVSIYQISDEHQMHIPHAEKADRSACLGERRLQRVILVDKDIDDPKLLSQPQKFCHSCVLARPNSFPESVVEHWALERLRQKSFR